MLDLVQQTSKATNIVIVLYKINMCIPGRCENTVAHTTHMLTAQVGKKIEKLYIVIGHAAALSCDRLLYGLIC
jgi:hypothetical protein